MEVNGLTMKTFIILLLAALTLASCNKEPFPPKESPAYFVFGIENCNCVGVCDRVFKLQENKLYRGHYTGCLQRSPDVSYKILPPARTDLGRKLLAQLPEQLLNATQDTFGCLSCTDAPVYLVSLYEKGAVRQWRISSNQRELPEWLRPFAGEMALALEELK
jgi:hypothetical protein